MKPLPLSIQRVYSSGAKSMYTMVGSSGQIVKCTDIKSSQTVGAILTYMLRLRREESFSTSLCVFCVRASARKTHTNLYYNVWSPQATRLYEDIAPAV